MLNIRLLIFGAALIIAGLILVFVLNLGGFWNGLGVAFEFAGLLLLGTNIILMMRNGRPGDPPKKR